MADILLSALVNTVVGNLNSSVLKEIESAWGLRSELDNLRSTLSTIDAVLQDAEEKQWNDKPVRNWLGKLKDVAYDADDVLDEFATEALIRKVEREKRALSKVRRFFTLPNRLIFRMKMAHNLKNVRDKLEAISKEKSSLHLREGVINMELNNSERRQTFSLVNESEIYGRGEEKEKMIQALLTNESDNLAIYAVWGMGGLGKTTLAQLVYNDLRVEKHFEMRIWVCVSDDFQITRLIKAIIESIDGRASDLSELDPLQKSLQEKLRGRKFLVVLDDVWNEDEVKWDGLKSVLWCGAKGSKVIVTTRIEKIALKMATLPIYHIGGLSEDDSWSLFKGRAFGKERAEKKLELESIGKEIVKKCGGVPLAIKALGSLMCLKGKKNEWLSVKESQIWDLPAGENSILPALRLSYHHLGPHMRQCFAYCCLFPKDAKLERDNLIQLWMALDFIPSRRPLELYDVGLDIFNELVWRSFFQDVEEESLGYITCKMHDLMHDLAQSIMELECLSVEPGKEVKVPDRIRHMSFPMYFFQNTSWNEDVRKVRSLRTCIGASSSSKKHLLFVSKQKSLRVWQFLNQTRTKMPFSSIKHVRYLNLSGSYFSVLSESITRLLNLQTLKLDDCVCLKKLPNGMKHMKKLTYLGLTNCSGLTRMSEGMGQLTCLQSLSCFIVGKDDGYQISELKGLNLRGKLCIKDLDNVRNLEQAKNADLIGKQNLHSLSLVWQSNNMSHVSEHVEDVLDGLQPHLNLKVLCISNYRGSKFPTWIQDLLLQDLVEISLDYCGRCELLPPLGKLRFLKVLAITGMGGVKYLGNEFHGDSAISFPSLTTFRLTSMCDLEDWTTVDGRESYPRLSKLRISWCPKLVELPIIPSITSLHIEGSNAMLIRSVRDLTSLSSLVIEDINELSVLPDGLLQNHKTLKLLHISRLPNLKELTNQLDNLSALKDFHLIHCDKLESLPDGLQNLHSLQELYICSCDNLLSFPMNGLRGLSSLRMLQIFSHRKLSSLSEGIQYLTALEDLIIVACSELTSLPEGIQHLTALRSLQILYCDKLTSLPEGIRHLTALRSLQILSCNSLSSLPKQIGSLRSLSFLDIEGCSNLMSIPDELQNLTALKRLDIRRCPYLERRCKKDSGEDWHKITHIPDINIYSE
uniref:Rx N-terminal domain-containing protein n=1 Tax=Fagus sylvatica TaxID=28930 RepID=A0A2N9HPM3_FAGSY